MKKIIFCLLLLVCITGCSSNYNIEIYNNQIKESMEFVNNDSSTWDDIVQYGFSYRDLLETSLDYPYPAFNNVVVDENDTIKLDGVEYYKNTLISDDYKLGQKLEYKNFKLNNFKESSIVKKCYQFFNIIEENDQIILSTSLKNNCFDEYQSLDEITVNLKTNHKVVSSNADIVKGYHYTWNITRENKDDAAILITLKKNDYIFNYENEFVKKIIYIGAIVGIIIVIGGSSYLYFKNKHDKLNEI